jgi:hypothetical protein
MDVVNAYFRKFYPLGNVPVSLVEQVIEKHGGVVE